jgi:chorismate dehydratase
MKLRLGSIEFINSLPVDLGLIEGAVEAPVEITRDVPARLNERMSSGALDIGPVSSIWYARHAKDFLLLPDLSISSESGVESVLLFSRLKMKELARGRVAVSEMGRTTPALLEVLCRGRYGAAPRIDAFSGIPDGIPREVDAVLLIGDEALKAKENWNGGDSEVIDLAEEWREWTGLGFVFAVWAVRRDVFEARPAEVWAAHRAILASKRWGSENTGRVIAKAVETSGLSEATARRYFGKLSYGFGPELQKGLKLYYQKAAELGILEVAPGLETIGSENLTAAGTGS